MISRVDFASIDSEIKKAIDDTLNDLKVSNQNDYALFLTDGEKHLLGAEPPKEYKIKTD